MPTALAILGQFKRQHTGKDQQVVLPWSDLYTIGFGEADPAFRDGCHHVAPTLDPIIMLEQAAGYTEIVRPRNIDGVAVYEGAEKLLTHGGQLVPAAANMVSGAQ